MKKWPEYESRTVTNPKTNATQTFVRTCVERDGKDVIYFYHQEKADLSELKDKLAELIAS